MQDLGIISPGLEEFRELAGHSRVIPVRLKVLADAETPIGLYRKLAHGQPGTFLMESAAVGGSWSRYSFIGSRSRATLTTKDGQAYWLGEPPVGVPLDGNPVDAIRDTVAALRTDRFDGLPPFTSGLDLCTVVVATKSYGGFFQTARRPIVSALNLRSSSSIGRVLNVRTDHFRRESCGPRHSNSLSWRHFC